MSRRFNDMDTFKDDIVTAVNRRNAMADSIIIHLDECLRILRQHDDFIIPEADYMLRCVRTRIEQEKHDIPKEFK